MLMAHARQVEPNTSNREVNSSLWKGVWSLQVPPKIRHMIWCGYGESCLRRLTCFVEKSSQIRFVKSAKGQAKMLCMLCEVRRLPRLCQACDDYK